jgi:hypothetical protein
VQRCATIRIGLLAACAAAMLAGCGPDGRQVRLCQRVLAEVEGLELHAFARISAETLPTGEAGVVLTFWDAGATLSPQRFSCRFRGARFQPGQSELIGVTRVSGEELSLPSLLHLRRRVGLE